MPARPVEGTLRVHVGLPVGLTEILTRADASKFYARWLCADLEKAHLFGFTSFLCTCRVEYGIVIVCPFWQHIGVT